MFMATRPSDSRADLLVRVAVDDAAWAETLPPVEDHGTLTVTVGHPDLVPTSLGATCARGYRIVGVASASRPVGSVVDVLLTAEARARWPQLAAALLARAERVFDLRMGPVQAVLAPQIRLHTQASC